MNEENVHITIESLATDDQFIAWVQDPTADLNVYWEKWLLDNPSKQKELDEARELVKTLRFEKSEDESAAENETWSNIQEAVDKEQDRVVKLVPWSKIGIAIAAGLALVMGVTLFMTNKPVNVHANFAEVVDHQLPDDSRVQLNAQSKITYTKGDWDDERKLNLTGEAFFEVKKGSDFVVETDLGSVKVLGTSFNVYARDKTLEVRCVTGKVSVTTTEGKVELIPGEEAIFSTLNNQLRENTFAMDEGIGWLEGKYEFENEALDKVIGEISRQFGVEVDLDPRLKARKYSGSFTNKNLDRALYQVCWPMKIQYHVDGKKVKITEEE